MSNSPRSDRETESGGDFAGETPGPARLDRARTGIDGLDRILGGGLPRHRLYLIQGEPGVGKTTLALQFLLEGVRRGERSLYITLSESHEEIREVAESHGWSLDGLEIFEFTSGEQVMTSQNASTVFYPSELELNEVTRRLRETVDRVRPQRAVFDSLSEVRLLAGDALRYRREILTLKADFMGRGCTVLLLDDQTDLADVQQLQSLAHGVISLQRESPTYGASRRRVEVVKVRGVRFVDGLHDFQIKTGGLDVYPRLIAAADRRRTERGVLPSGVAELDELLGGGLDRGSSTLLMGPAGIGKSTLALKYAVCAAERGERSALFIFDESLNTLLTRAEGLGFKLQPHLDSGMIRIQQVDPAELTAGSFAALVHGVANDGPKGASVVVIDGLNGYMSAMPDERHLTLHLHELLSSLNSRNVTVLMIVGQHGILGGNMGQPIDVSYLADTVVLFRYYEHAGEVRQALSVFKRRGGGHERTIRELRMGPPTGVIVGKPLREFRGVLTGTPHYFGDGART